MASPVQTTLPLSTELKPQIPDPLHPPIALFLWKNESYHFAIRAVTLLTQDASPRSLQIEMLAKRQIIEKVDRPLSEEVCRERHVTPIQKGGYLFYIPSSICSLLDHVRRELGRHVTMTLADTRDLLPKKDATRRERLERWKTLSIDISKWGRTWRWEEGDTLWGSCERRFSSYVRDILERSQRNIDDTLKRIQRINQSLMHFDDEPMSPEIESVYFGTLLQERGTNLQILIQALQAHKCSILERIKERVHPENETKDFIIELTEAGFDRLSLLKFCESDATTLHEFIRAEQFTKDSFLKYLIDKIEAKLGTLIRRLTIHELIPFKEISLSLHQLGCTRSDCELVMGISSKDAVRADLRKKVVELSASLRRQQIEYAHFAEANFSTECEMRLCSVAVSSFQGLRPHNEDHWCWGKVKVGDQLCPVFVLIDGHHGDLVAIILKERFIQILESRFDHDTLPQNPNDRDAYIEDKLSKAGVLAESIIRSQGLPKGGAALIAAFVFGDHIYVLNVGDCRAVVVDPSGIHQLSEDASPNSERYKKSIEKRGGIVTSPTEDDPGYRVSGFALARSIEAIKARGVTSRGKVMKYPIHPEGSTLALLSDGVTDSLTTRNIGECIERGRHLSASQISLTLVQAAFSNESSDNASALIARIQSAAKG